MSIDNRSDNAEKSFAFEEKQSFETEARCCKIFGLWVAEKLGLEGDDADTYAKTVIEANLEEPGFEDVIRAVTKDLTEKGLDVDREELCTELDNALQEAKAQLEK